MTETLARLNLPAPPPTALDHVDGDGGQVRSSGTDSQRAILNILEDLDTEKNRLESTQKALINMLDDLEFERRQVDNANSELRDVNEAMLDFIATAAHDMRSPLASMVGFSSLLTQNWAALSEEKRLQFVTTIDRQTHKLTWLVDDLLTLSSIEGGALKPQPELIPLGDAITGFIESRGRDAASVRVSCSPDLVAWVDPLHLARMIENYVENAFKYGEPPVRVEVSRNDDMAQIRVIDHGPGVPPEFVSKLFAKFARADIPSTRNEKGTGLGLSIVRGLAEANNGHASYERIAPRGSCFTVLLPMDERPRQ